MGSIVRWEASVLIMVCEIGVGDDLRWKLMAYKGAPLIKGVLTGDGRITCPWHGGTFLAPLRTSLVSMTLIL